MKPVPIKPAVSLAALDALDIRLGTIRSVQDIARADKLLRLVVDFGDHTRRIIAGMKEERDDPQQLVGVQALFVVNLEPRTIRGEVSEGMVLDVGYADGLLPALLRPEWPMPDGARAG